VKNGLLILTCLLLMAGCGKPVSQRWDNFRAYYNTYYNAQKSYKSGFNKIQRQPLEIDTSEVVRVHRVPLQAGAADFQEAIEKAADILRRFPESKWADDALFLIGKSYYYRHEFFPALEKFEELFQATDSPKLQQHAVIWKGRAQLDLGNHRSAIQFLETTLDSYPKPWLEDNKAEVRVLAAEHHALLREWVEASDLLSEALSDLSDKKLMGRSLFLYGQVLEHQKRYGEAYYAYSRVPDSFPGYEYTYWAQVKLAEVSRKEGNYDRAIAIFETLRRDDKNFERRNELAYSIGRSLEMKGAHSEAVDQYKRVLRQKAQNPTLSADLKAEVYYRIGRIYSDDFKNYSLASAYFDSSSSIGSRPPSARNPGEAQSLADALDAYSRHRQQIHRADSLLWLGSLSAEDLDSVVARIRVRKQQQTANREGQNSQNTLLNRPANINGTTTDEQASEYGFLNYRNTELVEQGKTEFRVVWGRRPLVDNWRRMEAVRRSSVREGGETERPESPLPQEDNTVNAQLNLEDIPRTQEQKRVLRMQRAKARYELGNLFYLSLSIPDSARHYFSRVINDPEADSTLKVQAMYSLYQLSRSGEDDYGIQKWSRRIMKEFPGTKYAEKVRSDLNNEKPAKLPADSSESLLQSYQRILEQEENSANKLRELALENRSSELAPVIYYQAIEAYIHQAKQTQDYITGADTMTIAGDSLINVIPDSIRSGRDEPVLYEYAAWDTVAMTLAEFDTTFPGARQQARVQKLRRELNQLRSDSAIPDCKKLGIELEVQPSMEAFLATVTYPEKLQGTSVSGDITYEFVVDGTGKVLSYRLISKETSLGIEEALESEFDRSLRFKPLNLKSPPPKLKCTVTFPIRL